MFTSPRSFFHNIRLFISKIFLPCPLTKKSATLESFFLPCHVTICIQKDAHRPGWICRYFRGSRRAGKFKPGISRPGGKYRKLTTAAAAAAVASSCSNLSHSWCMGEQLSYIHCWGVPQGSRSRPPASTGTLRYTPPVNVGNCTYPELILWNDLPTNVQSSKTLSTFKTKLRVHLSL